MRRRIGLATSLPGLGSLDDRAFARALSRRGWNSEILQWRAPLRSWIEFDAVIVCSCWDYQYDVEAFLAWAYALEREGCLLINPASLLAWNASKLYLTELEQLGACIVPTHVLDGHCTLLEVLDQRGWTVAVVKPAVSANANGTWRTTRSEAAGHEWRVRAMRDKGHDVLVQPFFNEVRERGEWSLIFFSGEFSHAVLRRPAKHDFRVQETFGGTTVSVRAPELLVRATTRILNQLPTMPMYVRIDGLMRSGEFYLMEVEAVEPCLYLCADDGALDRFVQATMAWIAERQSKCRSD